MSHQFYFISAFKIARTCTLDILRIKTQGSKIHKPDNAPVDIEKEIENWEAAEAVFSSQCFKPLFKLEVLMPDFQIDLLNDEYLEEEYVEESIFDNKDFNPFSTIANFMKKDSEENIQRKNSSESYQQIWLLSILIENTEITMNMLENVESQDKSTSLKLDLKVEDWIIANNLFTSDLELKWELMYESKHAPLHPKLFDTNLKFGTKQIHPYEPRIKNVLQQNPERVILYFQQGLKSFEINLFIILTESLPSVESLLSPTDLLLNLYKSLDSKLPFRLFYEYCSLLYQSTIKNEIFVDSQINGLTLVANNIHEWANYIPVYKEKEEKSGLVIKTGNKVTIKIGFTELGIDYTPYLSNKMWLEVYKNYEYNVPKENEDGDDGGEERYEEIYKTNTRIVCLCDISCAMEIQPDDDLFSIQIKLHEFSANLLWTSQYSPKWSSDLLIDYEQSLNSVYNGLLPKMGFVNVFTFKSVDISLQTELITDPITGKIMKPYKTPIASLSDIPDSEDIEIPTVYLSKRLVKLEARDLEEVIPHQVITGNINISSISIFCCHDSIWGFYLLSESANVHVSKSIKRLIKKMSQPPKEKSKKKYFEGVIDEVNDSSESDNEESKEFSQLQGNQNLNYSLYFNTFFRSWRNWNFRSSYEKEHI